MITKTYNPSWLIELAKEQHPKNHTLVKALKACKECFIDDAYIHFIYSHLKKPFKNNEYLLDEQGDEIIIDICEDGKIGGILLLKVVHKNESLLPLHKYDPSWLVELARKQHPQNTDLARALENCTHYYYKDERSIIFLDPKIKKYCKILDSLDDGSYSGIIYIERCNDGRIKRVKFKKLSSFGYSDL